MPRHSEPNLETPRPVVPYRFARDGLLGCSISSAGASLAVLFTNPLDVAQTRLKLQNELLPPSAPRAYRDTRACLVDTFRVQGVGGLQRGLPLAIVRESSKNFFRLGLYDPLLIRIHESSDEPAPMWKRFVAGFMSGGISALICNPLDLLKSRVQAVGRRSMQGIEDASAGGALQIARTMVCQEGWRSLWKGTGVSVLRSASGTAVTLAVDGCVKDVLASTSLRPGLATDVASSTVASVALSLTINPLEVVRVRLYNQKVDEAGRGRLYGSALDCVAKIWRAEGPLAFYKGVVASMYRTTPHVVLTLVFLGMIRREVRRLEQARLDLAWANAMAQANATEPEV